MSLLYEIATLSIFDYNPSFLNVSCHSATILSNSSFIYSLGIYRYSISPYLYFIIDAWHNGKGTLLLVLYHISLILSSRFTHTKKEAWNKLFRLLQYFRFSSFTVRCKYRLKYAIILLTVFMRSKIYEQIPGKSKDLCCQ